MKLTNMKLDKIAGLAMAIGVIFSLHAQLPTAETDLPEEIEEAEEVAQPSSPQPLPGEATEAVPEEEEKKAGTVPGAGAPGDEKVYLNVQDQDIKEVIKQISKATSRNFIIDSKVTGKITILSNKMMTKAEAYQAFLSALSVAGFTIVEGPGGILKIIPLRDAKNYPIPTHVDTTPLTDRFVTRLIKLENISSSAMAEAIKGLISRDGNLFAYPETNTLVLTDAGTNIDRLMKIIKELDQEGPQQKVEIIPLHFAGAKEVAGIVLSLFEGDKAGGARRPGEGGVAEAPQVSKIIADERTNSLIVLASKMAIDKVRELINRLDAKLEEGVEGKIHVHYLKHAKAKDVAGVLSSLSGAAKPAAGGQAGGAVVAELEEFKVASDDTTNSLLITSTAKTYNTLVEKVLNKLDIPRKQVYLEAMVVEFILARSKVFRLSGHGGAGGTAVGFGSTFNQLRSLINPFDTATNPGSPFLNSPGLLGGVLSRKRVNIDVTNADGTTRTFSLPAFSAFLTALATFGDTNIVASPSLLALDNEEASIEILRKEPEPGQTTISATGLQQVGTPSRIEAGLTLKLTPQITERGTVRLDIDQKFSFFTTPQNTALGTQAIQERKVKTAVVTNDGQTVIIGGLMQDEMTKEKTKVPILGDIPLLGLLFRADNSRKSKSNLILFITPHIIRDSSDFSKVLKRKMGQQDEFLTQNFKRKEKSDIQTTIKGHSPNIFDILESRTSPGSLAPMESGERSASAGEAVITAKPEEEEPPMTIVIPADDKAAKEMEKKQKEEEKRQRKEAERKKEEAQAQPPQAQPSSPPPPASTGDHAPVITLPTGTPPTWEE